MRKLELSLVGVLLLSSWPLGAQDTKRAEPASRSHKRVLIKGDEYRPFYPAVDNETHRVEDFLLDTYPVTNAEFLGFVKEHPQWRRDQVKKLFADPTYLEHWPGDSDVSGLEYKPVVHVSWFAARAYCDWRGGRLPVEHEWEFVARADETRVDATKDLAFNQRVLSFYSKPGGETLDDVGSGEPNIWGLFNVYGLIWEWVEDFNSSIVSSDNRQSGDSLDAQFCGGAALTAENTREYGTFMRYAFRSSLKPSFALHNLGFRCAYDLGAQPLDETKGEP